MAQKEPLLNLSTLVDREHILIDGERFEIRNRGELSILDLKAFSSIAKSIGDIVSKKEFSDDDAEELERLTVNALKRIVVGITDPVIAKLSTTARTSIVEVFTDRLSPRAEAVGPETAVQ